MPPPLPSPRVGPPHPLGRGMSVMNTPGGRYLKDTSVLTSFWGVPETPKAQKVRLFFCECALSVLPMFDLTPYRITFTTCRPTTAAVPRPGSRLSLHSR